MSETIKLRDKVTGEVITLRMKSSSPKKEERKSEPVKQITPGVDVPAINTDEAIAKRGTYWGNVKENLQSPNIARKAMGALGVVGAVPSAFNSAIGNPALEMQKGNFNPSDLAREAYLGFTGKKQGRPVDVYRRGGVPAPAASVMDFALSMSPVKTLQVAKRAFSPIAKLSDKGVAKAGSDLINASSQAEKAVGTQLNQAFLEVDTVRLDSDDAYRFIDSASKLPKVVLARLEDEFGKLDQIAQNMTVGQLRKMKQFIGKLRPSSFGKSERGVAENLDAEDLNKAYSGFKAILKDSIKKSRGEEEASKLMNLEKSYSEVSRASDYVKKTVVDPTLRKPTKGGSMAKKVTMEGDLSGRDAINTIRKSGKEARKSIDRALNSLEAFNKWQAATQFGQHAFNAMLYGGAMGGFGGYAMSKAIRRDSD